MKRLRVMSLIILSFMGCGTLRVQTLAVAKGSVVPGKGNSVAFKGKGLALEGKTVRVGERIPATRLIAGDLSEVDLADSRGRVRLISVVPSLDTRVCEEQTHVLSERNQGLDQPVQLVTVSMDLPFAQ